MIEMWDFVGFLLGMLCLAPFGVLFYWIIMESVRLSEEERKLNRELAKLRGPQ